jgi:hypothetical protein
MVLLFNPKPKQIQEGFSLNVEDKNSFAAQIPENIHQMEWKAVINYFFTISEQINFIIL